MNIPIFCLNLERATERRQLIQKTWINEICLNINFWKAYDRREIEKGNIIYPYSKEAAITVMGRELNYGEQACCTSYCMLYEYLIKESYSEVIIMEDDIYPCISNYIDLFSTIDEGKKEFPEAEIILLFQISPTAKIKKTTNKNFTLCNQHIWGNQLVYLNKIAIQKQYDLLKKMDRVADYRIYTDNKVILSNNPICKHLSNRDATTYIGYNKYRKFIL